jgi:hypothetical protein
MNAFASPALREAAKRKITLPQAGLFVLCTLAMINIKNVDFEYFTIFKPLINGDRN